MNLKIAAPADRCYVCGGSKHPPLDLHDFWSVADAMRQFAGEPTLSVSVPSMSERETLDPREAVWPA